MSEVLDAVNPEAALVPLTAETLEPLAQLAGLGVLDFTSLKLYEEISYDRYEAIGSMLGAVDRACRWWIGDWLIYGEGAFTADIYAQAASLTGLSEDTLAERATTSKLVPPGRRRHLVSYSVHVAVRKLPAREQTKWLKYAEQHGSSVRDLRRAIAAGDPQAPVDEHVEMRDVTEPIPDLVIEAANALLNHAQDAGENVICRREDVARLRAALGKE